MMDSATWNAQGHGLHPGPDEDFQQFLDMNAMSGMNDMNSLAGGLQFDFEFPNASGAGQHMQLPKDLDTHMAGADNAPSVVVGTSASAHPAIPAAMMPPPTPTEAISEIDAQINFLQQQRLQQQRRQLEEQNVVFLTRQSQIVPPTPQSLELQAGNQFFVSPDPHHQKQMQHQQQMHQHQQQTQQQNQQQAIYERYHQLKEQQDMSFTPLVSPAVTPLETQFPIDSQFTMPGGYFSPLTSPALHAQTDPVSVFDPRLSGTPPMDMELEALPAPGRAPTSAASMSSDLTKKARKSNAAKARKANVRQSPITKPQRKRMSTTPVINAQVLDQLAESLENEALSSPVIGQHGFHQPQHLHLTSAPMQLGPSSTSTGATDSENESVSPETLTDMPPPPLPKPRSARPSPYLMPQNHGHGHAATPSHILASSSVSSMSMVSSAAPMPGTISAVALPGGFPSPATPASLMKLASPQQTSHTPSSDPVGGSGNHEMPGSGSLGADAGAAATANEHIESFELPESLSMNFQKPQLAPISIHNTPIIQAVATTASPSLDPISARSATFPHMPSPIFAKPGSSTFPISTSGSATQSPQLLPGGGSMTSTPTLAPQAQTQAQTHRRTPQMLARSAKKRGSISSIHVSPALRPKISPNIKPLLPGGMSVAEDHASRLLASKSNYQNILEGNTVPGVSYPSELSTNLTSKRTSHKIAEQGRRNRINSALQEIATLLPRPPPKEGKSGDDGEGDSNGSGKGDGGKDGKGANAAGGLNSGPNSKASTVEMAIDYIKQLQQELAEATRRAEEAETKLKLKEEAESDDDGGGGRGRDDPAAATTAAIATPTTIPAA